MTGLLSAFSSAPMGKALSDAFVLVLDGRVSNGETGEVEEHCFYAGELEKTSREGNVPNGKILSEEVFHDGLKVAAEHIEESVAERIMDMQRAIIRQLAKELGEQALELFLSRIRLTESRMRKKRSKCRRRICRMQ